MKDALILNGEDLLRKTEQIKVRLINMEHLVYWNCKEKNSALPKQINEFGDVVSLEDVCAQLATIYDIVGDMSLDRFKEIVEAYYEDRFVILSKEEPLKKGDKVWYVDKDNGEIESGTVFMSYYKDGKLDTFSVDFDCGDFDEFYGSALGDCFFRSEDEAKAVFEKERNNE